MAAQLLRDPPEVRQYAARDDPPLDLWPGHISVLEPLGLTVTRAAEGLRVTRQALSELVNERASVSVEMSIGLSQAFGSTPETWLGLQTAYDLWQARSCGKQGGQDGWPSG